MGFKEVPVPQSAWDRGAFLSCQEKGWGQGSRTTRGPDRGLGSCCRPFLLLHMAFPSGESEDLNGRKSAAGPALTFPRVPALRLCRGSWSG